MLRYMCTDGDENRVKTSGQLFRKNILHLVVEDNLHSHLFNLRNLFHQILARQPISRNSEMQHATGQRTRFTNLDSMAQSGQMISSRQPTWGGTNDKYALARGSPLDRQGPTLLGGEIA